ncbi:MAG: exonuclease V subunit gamma [Puniceicoccaceae bacterium]|nr:MAG: exonuclease V subunit gamma [Puniceicoccaceae bacterium]
MGRQSGSRRLAGRALAGNRPPPRRTPSARPRRPPRPWPRRPAPPPPPPPPAPPPPPPPGWGGRPPPLPPRPGLLPASAAVFGVSTLPPLFLQLLRLAAFYVEIHLFVLQPTPLYWGDQPGRRQAAREAPSPGRSWHPLLVSWGRQGRDLVNLLLDADAHPATESFQPPPRRSLLEHLRADLFDLHDPAPADPVTTPAEDDSIRIHCCHGPLREVEVLHDQILDALRRDSSLQLHDILVMAPDIEDYAPYIEAVFGAPENPALRLTYNLADRRPVSEFSLVETFLRLLEWAGSRLPVTAALGLLESPALRLRHDFTEEDLGHLRSWIVAADVRWGRDAAHRAAFDGPDRPDNTWTHGRDRLLAAYFLDPGAADRPLAGIMPASGPDPAQADLFSRFLQALEDLLRIDDLATQPRQPHDWTVVLESLLEDWFAPHPVLTEDCSLLRRALGRLRQAALALDPLPACGLAEIRLALDALLEQTRPASGFLTRGITFCSLKPMRAIPARVIALLGLDDRTFPRRDQRSSLDRTADQPRPGDRSASGDDRQLFLECLLSARDRLHLSYPGISPRDLAEKPRSVVLEELIDHLDQAYRISGDKPVPAGQGCLVHHRLQGFAPAYFENGPLFTFSPAAAEVRSALEAGPAAASPFLDPAHLLPPASDPPSDCVDLSDLVDCFTHPSRWFLTRRLGLRFPSAGDLPCDEEPITPDRLERYQLEAWLAGRILGGDPPTDEDITARNRGCNFPSGAVGDLAARASAAATTRWLRDVPAMPGPPSSWPQHELDLGNIRLRARLPANTATLVLARPGTLGPKDLVTAWLHHLAFACLRGPGTEATTRLHCHNRAVAFAPPADPAGLLRGFTAWFQSAHLQPLRFLPDPSLAFAKVGADPAAARQAARREWEERPYTEHGDSPRPTLAEDPWNRILYATTDPFDDSFEDLARRIFNPLLEALDKAP